MKRKISVGDQVELKSNGIRATVVDVNESGHLTLVAHNGPHCNWQEYSGYGFMQNAVELVVHADEDESTDYRLYHLKQREQLVKAAERILTHCATEHLEQSTVPMRDMRRLEKAVYGPSTDTTK